MRKLFFSLLLTVLLPKVLKATELTQAEIPDSCWSFTDTLTVATPYTLYSRIAIVDLTPRMTDNLHRCEIAGGVLIYRLLSDRHVLVLGREIRDPRYEVYKRVLLAPKDEFGHRWAYTKNFVDVHYFHIRKDCCQYEKDQLEQLLIMNKYGRSVTWEE